MLTAEYEVTIICKLNVNVSCEEKNINYLHHMAEKQGLQEFLIKQMECIDNISAKRINLSNYKKGDK